MSLNDLISQKESVIVSTKASATLLDATRTMMSHKVGSLLVYSEDDEMVGIITERDILRFCADHSDTLANTLVEERMTRDPMVVTLDCSIDQAMTLMTNHRFRHLPIMHDHAPVGIISIGDLVKAKLKDVSVEVKYLREFISA